MATQPRLEAHREVELMLREHKELMLKEHRTHRQGRHQRIHLQRARCPRLALSCQTAILVAKALSFHRIHEAVNSAADQHLQLGVAFCLQEESHKGCIFLLDMDLILPAYRNLASQPA